MNKMLQAITTVMIILLLVILIWIFISYYKDADTINTIASLSGNTSVSTPGIPNKDYMSEGKKQYDYDNLIESIQSMSGEGSKKNETSIKNENELSGESNSEENIYESGNKMIENIDDQIENQDERPDNQLVIVSDPETSNEEKQEVLTEIDEALKGLLEAVGKVEIVDETRLDASLNSEVEIP